MAKGRRRYPIIDSHIHLYPRSENDSIGWIDPDHHLAGQWSVDQYRHATKTASSSLYGFVVVEVNRTHDDDLETGKTDGSGWRGPLQEVAYMSRIALGEPRDGEGHSAEDSKRCLGLVPWAPITSGPAVLERYLGSVRKVAGAAWPRVRGFRYLLQDSPCGLFQRGEFVDSVKMLGRRGFVFEICADYHGRGQGQLDDAVALAELAHEGVRESDQVTLVISRFLGGPSETSFYSHETGRSLFKARLDGCRRAIRRILPSLGRRDRSPREKQEYLHQNLWSFQRDFGGD
jgi:L-rhamnono-1,4-lactonase